MTNPKLPVIVAFNRASARTRPEDRAAEAGVLEAVGAAAAALAPAGYSVETLGMDQDVQPLVDRLRASRAVVVNFCEGLAGRAEHEAHVAGLLELLEVPYTGSTPQAILLCLDKIRTKRFLAGCGLPTPPFFEFRAEHVRLSDSELRDELARRRLEWPMLAKPARQDASQGVHQDSVVESVAALRAAVDRVANGYGFPVLVEQFLSGREFNIAVIDDPGPRALPITEIVFKPSERLRWPIVTYNAKWDVGGEEDLATAPRCPAELTEQTAGELSRLALEAIRLTGCRDYARVDLRLGPTGEPFILEVNANPDLSPSGGLVHQLAAAGISHDVFFVRLVERAARRCARPGDGDGRSRTAAWRLSESSGRSRASSGPRVELRGLRAADRESIGQLLQRCGNFRPEEIAVALELVDETVQETGVEDYRFVIAELDGRVVGYCCFGPVPLTDGVWDLYWIAADPSLRGQGVGARVQAAAERQIKAAGGRLVLAETSSLPSYAAAREFYVRQGYDLLERIADFYRPGDDRLTFGKRL